MRTIVSTFAAAVVAVGFVAVGPAPAQADMIYGVSYFDQQLVSINPTTGAGTVVGSLGASLPFGLALSGGNLYTYDSAAGTLDQISMQNGSVLSTANVGIGPVLGQGGLAFQSSSVGFLSSALDPTTFNPVNDLYRFNLATGTSTVITTTDTLNGLAFGANGTLYGLATDTGTLYTVNTTTGALTALGSGVGNVGFTPGNTVASLTTGPNGAMFASLNDTLYSMNLTTGVASLVNSNSPGIGAFSVSGLAYVPSAVPEPSSALLGAAAVACAVGLSAGRRVWKRRVG